GNSWARNPKLWRQFMNSEVPISRIDPGLGPDRQAIQTRPSVSISDREIDRLTELVRPSRIERSAELLALFSPILLLLLWEAVGRVGLLDPRFFPAPSAIVSAFIEDLGSGEVAAHVKATLWRVSVGMVMGLIPALTLGLVLGL